VVPAMGRAHFFALFSVIANLTLGIAPVLWGLFIDAFGQRRVSMLGIEWNRFSLSRRLEEPRAGRVEDLLRDLLAQTPMRSWIRFWPRG